VQRANVSLSDGAEVNVRAQDGGSIAINAQNVSLAGGSKLRAGIETGLGTQQSKAGDIEINAKGETVLGNGSFIANLVQPEATGQGGNINITTGALTLGNGAALNTATYGLGNGGNVSVLSSGPVSLVGGNIFTSVQAGAVGNGGDINIQGASLSLTDGALLNTATFGRGNGGSVSVVSSGTVSLVDGKILTGVDAGAVGNGGDINIQGASLSLTDGTQLISTVTEADSTNPAGRGNAGNVNINVRDALTISGEKDGFVSAIFSLIEPGAIGNGGNISISAGSVTLTSGPNLDAASYGLGNGGDIIINARDTVTFDGVDSNGIPTRARTALLPSGEGIAGDIKITTGSLFLSNGASIFSDTFGKGNGGSITINARDTVSVDGSSSVSSNVASLAVGNGGDIRVTTGSLSLTNGAQVSSKVTGQGNGGNITIDARDTVKLDGIGNPIAGIQSDLLTGTGKGGDILVLTGSLSVTNSARLSANTNGRGNAGNITINARDTVTFDGVGNNESPFGSGASTEVGSKGIGNGGDIRVSARELLLKNGGQLATDSFGQGKAGNIQINVSDTVTFDGSSNNGRGSGANTLATENSSKAGDIFVTTGTLSLTNGGNLFTFAQTFAGNITINARDAVIFDGTNDKGGVPSAANSLLFDGTGKGGDIKVTTGSLTVRNGAVVTSSTSGQGDAGNVIIDARGQVSFDNGFALSTVNQNGVGKGGDIRISADSISVTNGAQLASSTFGKG
ncbi:MAG: S-layer family protein, partial [Stigonema ocellatum SAG 48.90 = DSM 106950]|nr:S-layer family protein [Stigonema ocellatum SAG 48.90 = DSM 106950]